MKLNIPRVVRQWRYARLIEPNLNFELNAVGSGRRYATQVSATYWKESFAEFGLQPVAVEPIFKNMTGNNYEDGAFVHQHIDSAPNGFVHVRCNVMLRKPHQGGNPILDNEEIHVDTGDLWLCLASMELHGSTPILGGDRLIFSFGGLVPMAQVQKIIST